MDVGINRRRGAPVSCGQYKHRERARLHFALYLQRELDPTSVNVQAVKKKRDGVCPEIVLLNYGISNERRLDTSSLSNFPLFIGLRESSFFYCIYRVVTMVDRCFCIIQSNDILNIKILS